MSRFASENEVRDCCCFYMTENRQRWVMEASSKGNCHHSTGFVCSGYQVKALISQWNRERGMLLTLPLNSVK